MNSKQIVETTKEKLEYWKKYVKIFEATNKNIDANRKELAKKLMDDPNSKEIRGQVEYLFYDYNMNIQDLNQLTQELATLYRVIDKKDFTEEEIEKLDEIKEGSRKQIFMVETNKLVERVKGQREKHVNSIKTSPHYNQIIKTIKENLEK